MKQIQIKDVKPRTTMPTRNDRLYNRVGYNNGLSPCVKGKPEAWPGSVLSNCVGYAFARFCEIASMEPAECKLGKTAGVAYPQHANQWWSHDKSGYHHSQQPRVGACWCGIRKSDGLGHVMIVEDVYQNGDIMVSGSSWNGRAFYNKTLTKASNYSYGKAWFTQGFIYNPAVIDNKPEQQLQKGDKIQIIGTGNARKDGKGKTSYGKGWKRYILNYYEGEPYPYRVGNRLGVTTGYYKADALKKVN